jgi:hypothetical protein
MGKRMTIRAAQEPIDAEICDGEHRIPGKLADISGSGVGVTLPPHLRLTWFSKGQEVGGFPPACCKLTRCRGKVIAWCTSRLLPPPHGLLDPHQPACQPELREYVELRQKSCWKSFYRVHIDGAGARRQNIIEGLHICVGERSPPLHKYRLIDPCLCAVCP